MPRTTAPDRRRQEAESPMPADSTPDARVERMVHALRTEILRQSPVLHTVRDFGDGTVAVDGDIDLPALALAAIALADQEAAERVPADVWGRFSELTDMALESYAFLITVARHDSSDPGYTAQVEMAEKDHDANRTALDAFVRSLIAPSASAVELVDRFEQTAQARITGSGPDLGPARDRLLRHIALAEARGAVPKGFAVAEALFKLVTVAEGQKAYWMKRQLAEKSYERGLDEDGNYTPVGEEAISRHSYCNGRYSEADWWLSTIRSHISTAPRPADLSTQAEGGGNDGE